MNGITYPLRIRVNCLPAPVQMSAEGGPLLLRVLTAYRGIKARTEPKGAAVTVLFLGGNKCTLKSSSMKVKQVIHPERQGPAVFNVRLAVSRVIGLCVDG